MATDIMKSLNVASSILDQNEVKASDFKSTVGARLGEPQSMSHEKPVFGEDGSPFQLVEYGLRIPR